MSNKRGVATRRMMLAYITKYIKTYGFPPSFREIAEGTGVVSVSTVGHHLDILVAQGKITREFNRARSLRVVGE